MTLRQLCATFSKRADKWEADRGGDELGQIVAAEIRTLVDAFEQLGSTSYITQSSSPGKPSTVYLSDGRKITVGRNRKTGQAWLEISEQARIIPISSGVEAAQSPESLSGNNKARGGTGEENTQPETP